MGSLNLDTVNRSPDMVNRSPGMVNLNPAMVSRSRVTVSPNLGRTRVTTSLQATADRRPHPSGRSRQGT